MSRWTRMPGAIFACLVVVLLFGVMSTAPPLSRAQPSADLVLLNGKVVTADKNFSIKQAVAIRDGKFLAVGINEEVRPLVGPATRTIDLKGRTVLKPIGVGEQVTVGVFDPDRPVPHPPTFSAKALEDWKTIVKMLAESGWRFQVHSTHDSSARQLLPAIEEVNQQISLKDRRLAFAHMENATVETIDRIKAIGGGITVQDRMIYFGADVAKEVGREVARRAPPLKTMVRRGLPVGGGTDSTRTAPYLPFWSIWWLVTGKTLGGESIRGPEENLSREEALRVYTTGSAWFNLDEGKLGSIEPGKLADLIVLTEDYLTVPEDRIKDLHSVLTIVGGKPVYAEGEYSALSAR